jgi:hypothetical protein
MSAYADILVQMSAYADILRPKGENASFFLNNKFFKKNQQQECNDNVFSVHAVETIRKERWLRCIHSWSRHYAQLSCKLRIPAALYPETQAAWLFTTACLEDLE